jgi:hypothetical protein
MNENPPRAMHIDHFEDLIFDYGGQGIEICNKILQTLAGGGGNLSLKMDGKPAVVFGRTTGGEFVLTDKSAFMAKTYNGVATSVDMLVGILMSRRGDRTELVEMYRTLWPILEDATPLDFRGFLQADLLWCNNLNKSDNYYYFTPNVVEYRIEKNSDMGKRVHNKTAGLVIHSYYANNKTHPRPVSGEVLSDTKSAMFYDPVINNVRVVVGNEIQRISRYSSIIDQLLNPEVLRTQNISILPSLLKKWINHNIRVGNFDGLDTGFVEWIGYESIPENKKQRIRDYFKNNDKYFKVIFKIFKILYSKKIQILQSFNRIPMQVLAYVGKHPSHEGFVFETDGIYVKFVDRFLFSKTNFFRNN